MAEVNSVRMLGERFRDEVRLKQAVGPPAHSGTAFAMISRPCLTSADASLLTASTVIPYISAQRRKRL